MNFEQFKLIKISTNGQNERWSKERLGTSRLNDVFLKIYPYDFIITLALKNDSSLQINCENLIIGFTAGFRTRLAFTTLDWN